MSNELIIVKYPELPLSVMLDDDFMKKRINTYQAYTDLMFARCEATSFVNLALYYNKMQRYRNFWLPGRLSVDRSGGWSNCHHVVFNWFSTDEGHRDHQETFELIYWIMHTEDVISDRVYLRLRKWQYPLVANSPFASHAMMYYDDICTVNRSFIDHDEALKKFQNLY